MDPTNIDTEVEIRAPTPEEMEEAQRMSEVKGPPISDELRQWVAASVNEALHGADRWPDPPENLRAEIERLTGRARLP